MDDDTLKFLQSFGFDSRRFESLRKAVEDGEPYENTVQLPIEPPRSADLRPLPPLGSSERARLEEIGIDSLRRGEVGAIVLAGGMATRFGGAVKAAVPAIRGKTFLELKLADVARTAARAGRPVPVFVMTSFATHEAVTQLAREVANEHAPCFTFPQFIDVRLEPDGSIAQDERGAPSLYAPGHGDLPFALKRAGLLERFRASGGRHLFMSNVDNLTATLDPAIIGAHIDGGAELTALVAEKHPGDRGGAPARVAGRLEIVEGFRFPRDFDQDQIPVFNTNTFVFDAERLEEPFDLDFFRVEKSVEGRDVLQFERLVGQLSAFLETSCLVVERTGPDARFQPIKVPDDLERQGPLIDEILVTRGILSPRESD
jgi:UTP--glucose-1-phosphate uridylyltransferase